jgi:effector-binding domain-containing protein
MSTTMTAERKPGTFELVAHAAQPTAVIPTETTSDAVGPALGQAFAEVLATLGRAGVAPVGPPFARYFEYSPARVTLEAGFPVAAPVSRDGRVMPGELPAGRIAQAMHAGGYDTVAETYGRLESWIRERGHTPAGPPWEVYLTDPTSEPDPSRWLTQILWPVR